MNSSTPDSNDTWVEVVTQFLLQEEQVEAIEIRPGEKRIRLATLGRVDRQALQKRLDTLLRDLDQRWLKSPAAPGTAATLPSAPNPHPRMIELEQSAQIIQLKKPSCPTSPKFWMWRQYQWPEAERMEQQSREEWQAMALQATICGVCMVAAYSLERLHTAPAWFTAGLWVISIIAGAWDAAIESWHDLKKKQFDIHFLMISVALGAISIGAWEEGALLLFLFSTSGALEHYVLHRTHREINALTKAAPKLAHQLLPDGSLIERPVDAIQPGDLLLVRPGELFPVDGEVHQGSSAADESTLTGEAMPVDKQPGAELFGGTLNLWGRVEMRVSRAAQESALQRIIGLIQTAQNMKAPSQRFTDRFGTGYTILVLGLVGLMFLFWWRLQGQPAFRGPGGDASGSAFYRAMTLLVVMSPCALVLSIPSAILAAISWGARRGILFRGGAAIEKLAEVDVVALDKTGTLTAGEMQVLEVESFPPGGENAILQSALDLEANSTHPIARAIQQHGKAAGLRARTLSDFQSITGQGLRGQGPDGVCYIGRREMIAASEQAHWLQSVDEAPLGITDVWVLHPQWIGRILLQDEIREGSRLVLSSLSAQNIRSIMLTGDRRNAAVQIGTQIGISEVRAGLHPEDKVAAIQELTAQGHRVAMVGDGVNDAPSLAAAYVSVAMGARGSDAALEQADIVLMRDRIEKLLSARQISLRARSVIRQNISIALGAVAVMAAATIIGHVPLTLGVLVHEGSTVVVCLNSLRLLFVKEATQV